MSAIRAPKKRRKMRCLCPFNILRLCSQRPCSSVQTDHRHHLPIPTQTIVFYLLLTYSKPGLFLWFAIFLNLRTLEVLPVEVAFDHCYCRMGQRSDRICLVTAVL
ncbi:hypothetical protein L596_029209 [Steinernema carpocapsae]|uniref:Uncharacterized protein n=1 Tax=Steinernema carpocapsae TaxID=34508 RepID=A0A4U5LTZ4_STECR|nr:hypothetical protein L596_029209 [Steinernema carpocapsae]